MSRIALGTNQHPIRVFLPQFHHWSMKLLPCLCPVWKLRTYFLPPRQLNSFMAWCLCIDVTVQFLISVHLVHQKQQKKKEMKELTSSPLHQGTCMSVSFASWCWVYSNTRAHLSNFGSSRIICLQHWRWVCESQRSSKCAAQMQVRCDRMGMDYGKNFVMVTEIISIVSFIMLCVWDNVAWSSDLSWN